MKRCDLVWSFSLVALAYGLCSPAAAQLVRLSWTGLVTETERLDVAPTLLQGVTAGDVFSVEIIVDKVAIEAGNPTGIYAGPAEEVTITIGAASATSDIFSLLTVDFFPVGPLHQEFAVLWDMPQTASYFTDGSAVFEGWSARAGLPLGSLKSGAIPTDLNVAGNFLLPDQGATNIGWSSTVVTGEGEVSSWIGGEIFNVRAEVVPAPGAAATLLAGFAVACHRRRAAAPIERSAVSAIR